MYIRTDGQKKAKQLQYPSIDTYALQLELISLSLLNISSIYRNLFCILWMGTCRPQSICVMPIVNPVQKLILTHCDICTYQVEGTNDPASNYYILYSHERGPMPCTMHLTLGSDRGDGPIFKMQFSMKDCTACADDLIICVATQI